MGSFGGFYKGEKKKKKQGESKNMGSFTPVFVPPVVMGKGRKEK